jgi:hypothetical protein
MLMHHLQIFSTVLELGHKHKADRHQKGKIFYASQTHISAISARVEDGSAEILKGGMIEDSKSLVESERKGGWTVTMVAHKVHQKSDRHYQDVLIISYGAGSMRGV